MNTNADLDLISKELTTNNLQSFNRFCKHLVKMRSKAEEAANSEEMLARLNKVANSYLDNSYFKLCDTKTKSSFKRYISFLLESDDVSSYEEVTELDIVPPKPEEEKKVCQGHIKSNVIVLSGASILLCKYGEIWKLPGGFCNQNENARASAIRNAQEQAGITLLNSKLHIISSYESSNYDPTERYMVVNFMYAPTYKMNSYYGSCDKSEMIAFDKILAMNIDSDDYKVIKGFIMK